MAATLKDMIAQKEALEKQIEEVTSKGRSDAISKVKAMMAEYGLTMADLGGTARTQTKSKVTGKKVAAKYRNEATGESWSGRGLQPRWLKAAVASGKKQSDFAV